MNIMLITLISVVGLNVVTGYCGQISLGQAAFMAMGAYISAFCSTRFGWSFWAVLPIGGLAAALTGLIFGLPSLRVKGFYLVIATVAAQFIIIYLLSHLPWFSGSTGMTVSAPQLGSIDFASRQNYYYINLGVAGIMLFLAKNLARSDIGRAFIAIRDNDLAAEVLGIDTFRYKLLAFVISAFYAGIAGCLLGFYTRYIQFEQYSLMDSIWQLGMLIVGGMGSSMGAIFGTLFIKLLDEGAATLSPTLANIFPQISSGIWAGLSPMVYGAIIIAFLVLEPRGINHRWLIFKASYRLWPFSY